MNCKNCNSIIENPKKGQKWCSNGCKQSAYRKRNNIPEPEFLKKSIGASSFKTVLAPARASVPAQTQASEIQFRSSSDREIWQEEQKIIYNQWVIEDAMRGVFPGWTIAGTLIGASTGKKDGEKLLMAAVLAIIGKAIDDGRKAERDAKANEIIWQATTQIEKSKKRIAELRRVDKTVRSWVKNGLLVEGNDEQKVKLSPTLVRGKDYAKENIPSLTFSGKWKYLMGNPEPNFYLVVSGAPGSGKTTFSVQFSDYFQKHHGNVLYMTAEQGKSKSFQDLIRRYGDSFDIEYDPKKHSIQELAELASKYKLVVFDSLNFMKLEPEDIELIRSLTDKKTAIVGILQNTKAGVFKGSNEFIHDCDVHVIVDAGKARTEGKSRFAPSGAEVEVFEGS